MASSMFWKQREEDFRRHANDESNSLAADWYSITDSWTFRGGSVGRSERIFKSLARMAARGLKGNLGADACKCWLDALRHGEYGFELRFRHGGAYNQKRLDYLRLSGEAVPLVEGIVETVTLPDGSAETRTRVEGITGTIDWFPGDSHLFAGAPQFRSLPWQSGEVVGKPIKTGRSCSIGRQYPFLDAVVGKL